MYFEVLSQGALPEGAVVWAGTESCGVGGQPDQWMGQGLWRWPDGQRT